MELLTTDEIVALVKSRNSTISPARVRQLCADGTIKAVKTGRDWVIRKSDAERFVTEWVSSR